MLRRSVYTKPMMIDVQTISKRFGSFTAVSEVAFGVKKGEVVGFVGANGAGKSTTINMLLGFLRPSEGAIELCGQTVRPESAHRRHDQIGFAAGDMELPGKITGEQYLRFVATQSKRDHATLRERQSELVQRFAPELHKRIASLSRGNKQKIALIAAFLTNPEVVILDEPTSGLDPIMQETFLELVRAEQARGVTVFMSSHYLNEVVDVCSRVIFMRRGRVVEDVAVKELMARSGKRVRVVTGYGRTRAPRGAEDVTTEKDTSGQTVVGFLWKKAPAELQQWLAGVKQLQDIEVTEYDIDGAFHDLYTDEEAGV